MVDSRGGAHGGDNRSATTIGEAPADLEQPVPPEVCATVAQNNSPLPEAISVAEAAAPDAGEQAAAEAPTAAPAAPAPPVANGRVPLEIEYPIGSTRQRILDHFQDSEGDQSIAAILAAMPPGTSRNTLESGVRRELESGRLLRISPGVYRLAPRRPLGQPAPPPEPEPDGLTDEQWLSALDAWLADGAWDVEAL